MRREFVRDKKEKRPRKDGGSSWKDCVNNLGAEFDAFKEDARAQEVANRAIFKGLVESNERLARRFERLEQRYTAAVENGNGNGKHQARIDVQAHVEEEEPPTVG